MGGGSITAWQDWCLHALSKINNDALPETEIVAGFLRSEVLSSRPSSVPLSVEWGDPLTTDLIENISVFFNDRKVALDDVDFLVIDPSDSGPIRICLRNEAERAVYRLTIDRATAPGFTYQAESALRIAFITRGGDRVSLEEYMIRHPLVIRYADGSFGYNNIFVDVHSLSAPLRRAALHVIDW